MEDRIKKVKYIGLLRKNNGKLEEVKGNNYKRQLIQLEEHTSFCPSAFSNINEILFVNDSEEWGAIEYAGLYEGETDGKTLYTSKLDYETFLDTTYTIFKIPVRNFMIDKEIYNN